MLRYIVGPFGGYAGAGRLTNTRYGRGLLPATATTNRCRTPVGKRRRLKRKQNSLR